MQQLHVGRLKAPWDTHINLMRLWRQSRTHWATSHHQGACYSKPASSKCCDNPCARLSPALANREGWVLQFIKDWQHQYNPEKKKKKIASTPRMLASNILDPLHYAWWMGFCLTLKRCDFLCNRAQRYMVSWLSMQAKMAAWDPGNPSEDYRHSSTGLTGHKNMSGRSGSQHLRVSLGVNEGGY